MKGSGRSVFRQDAVPRKALTVDTITVAWARPDLLISHQISRGTRASRPKKAG